MPILLVYGYWEVLGSVEGGEALWLRTEEDVRVRFPDTASIGKIRAMLEDKEIEVGELLNCVPVSGWDGEVMAHFAHLNRLTPA